MFKQDNEVFGVFSSQDYDNSVSGVENITRKRRGKKIAMISGISASALIVSGIAAYNLSPFVKNQVKLRVMKPENYYSWIYEENSKDIAKKAREKYETYLTRYEEGQRSSVNFKYEPSDEALEQFIDEIFDDDYDLLSKEEKDFYDVVKGTESIGLDLDINHKLNDSQFTVGADFNDERLVSFDLFTDLAEGDIFFRVPELTEKWLDLSVGDYLVERSNSTDSEKLYSIFKDVIEDPREYLTPAELESEIIRYTDVWNDCVDKVKLKKSEEISIGAIETKYTVATVTIDEELSKEIVSNFVDAAKDDEILYGIAVEKTGVYTEEEFYDLLDEIKSDIEEDDDRYYDDFDDEDDKVEKDDDYSVTFKTYIDPKGVIRGFDIESSDGDDTRAIIGKDGDRVCGEFKVVENGETKYEAELDAEENEKDVYSGEIELVSYRKHYDIDTEDFTVSPKKYSVEFEDFEIINDERNYFDADITITVEDKDPIVLDFDADDSSQSVSYEVVVDDVDYGKLILTWSTTDDCDIDIPSKDDSFVIDKDNRKTVKFEDYVSRDEMDSFVTELLEKVGIDSKSARKYAADAVREIYDDIADEIKGRPDYDEYERYDDYDFDYDFDDDLEYNF
ncbi:MAG: hypothetical protein IJM38_08495 [Ruminococcus sp.]|nr:hypothetical protein [Ruminococcus sp.]